MIELFQMLLRTGFRAGRRAGPVRTAGLFAAALVIAAGMMASAMVHGGYAVRGYRLDARSVVPAGFKTEDRAALLWRETTDRLRDGREFRIVFLTPLADFAALPPGVRDWPARGEVLLSPALRDAGAAEGIERRYGRMVGTISIRGLVDGSELLAYIRPRQDLSPEQADAIVGFGPTLARDRLVVVREDPNLKPEWMLQALVSGMLLAPGAGLVFVVTRSGSRVRRRHAALLAALGGRSVHGVAMAVGEASRPVFQGTALGAFASSFATFIGLTSPFTGYQMTEVGPYTLGLLVASTVLAAALTLTLVMLCEAVPERGWSTGPRWGLLCPVLAGLAWYGPDLFPSGSVARLVTYGVGVVGVLLTLPAAVALVTAGLARLWGYLGRVRRSAALLVAGRDLAAHPGAVAGVVAGVTIGLCLFAQALAWQPVFGAEPRIEQRTPARLEQSALDIKPLGKVTESQVERFLAGLPSGTRVLVLRSQPDRLRFQGSCQDLSALALPCPSGPAELAGVPADPRVRDLVARHGRGSGSPVEVAPVGEPARAVAEGAGGRLILVRQPGGLSIPDLKRLSHLAFPMGGAVESATSEPVRVVPDRHQAGWLVLFGVAGVLVLTVAAGLAGVRRFLRRCRTLAPLRLFGSTDAVLRSSATWWVLVPLTVAGVAGTTVGALLAVPVMAVTGSSIPFALLIVCVALIVTLGFVITRWGAGIAIQQAEARYGIGSGPAPHDSGSAGPAGAKRRTSDAANASRIRELYAPPSWVSWK